ncbi:uncharacterized protein BDR25DRAFT_382335 [Lindgomyces ingoldianus]|uniref:Uncharacterized protein n=1 Tax=Lindgomyces ingoldianus TaxID=673940 RepID=A0ACB6R7U8_9PLEO|nr:uncharacterized protein BDR25DRAFT_382335 [Lindgomyces ingoldianus]KAF2475383.1 hypothetical protein BDR25DRAFT_382335 [Lindgomyces ingoldianus]
MDPTRLNPGAGPTPSPTTSTSSPTDHPLSFIGFPPGQIFTPTSPILNLTWQNRNQYVNISLSRFDYYGGGDIFQDFVASGSLSPHLPRSSQARTPESGRALSFQETDSMSYTLSRDVKLATGVYAFFISTVGKPPSESPFFVYLNSALLVPSNTSTTIPSVSPLNKGDSGLTSAQKVGVGLGVPFAVLVLGVIGWGVWWLRKQRGMRAEVSPGDKNVAGMREEETGGDERRRETTESSAGEQDTARELEGIEIRRE